MPRRNHKTPRGGTKRRARPQYRGKGRPKPCAGCFGGATFDWKDSAGLRKYISDRGKIRGRRVTGLCPPHQRQVAIAVKNAREMALLPYIGSTR